ncbi:colicin E3/pyocin S6 family cytotoxin [Planktothricoides sp. SR001]|uniref:colicin E3/pyocin S6 family cytotoxin n=1 Tax=Planktothricoides sp. SR001 TaxID=1705388 RepID=UPI0009E7D24D|nr:colicin E3/pyocin S6 family cytotoxin [Planktothricoides sp. SR001]
MSEPYKKNQDQNSVNVHRITEEQIQQGFPGAKRIRSKTNIKGGSKRKRWQWKKFILDEDTQHEAVEKFRESDGKHLGECDPQTGEQTKPANPKRRLQR